MGLVFFLENTCVIEMPLCLYSAAEKFPQHSLIHSLNQELPFISSPSIVQNLKSAIHSLCDWAINLGTLCLYPHFLNKDNNRIYSIEELYMLNE